LFGRVVNFLDLYDIRAHAEDAIDLKIKRVTLCYLLPIRESV